MSTTQSPLSLLEASELRYLEPAKLHFFRAGSTLRLTIEAELSCLSVSVVRLFPLSEPQRYLSVRTSDNKEVGVLRDAAELSAQGRQLVKEELERRYLVPAIQRVITVKERFGTLDWQVQTDRGERQFTTRNLRENMTQPSPNRYLLTDVDGNRYDVLNLNALDAASRSHLMRHL